MEIGLSVDSLPYHIWTLWLFTASDVKTTLAPSILFALLHLLASPLFGLGSLQSKIFHLEMLGRFLLSCLWVWAHLLAFCVSNQRHPDSILEDVQNKPWRPIPSGRISAARTTKLAFASHLLALSLALCFGSLPQSLVLAFCGFMYNDTGLANQNFAMRNILNAAGFVCFISAAFEMLLPGNSALSSPGTAADASIWSWLTVIALVVASTIQTQDMPDQPGDALRGRKTMPLVVGDVRTRLIIAVFMVTWGGFCPAYWRLSYAASTTFVGVSLVVAFRTLNKRSTSADKKTFLLWNVWIINLYILPLLRFGESLSKA